MTNNYVMLHDEKRCIGCQACTAACKVVNDVPAGFNRVQVQIRGPQKIGNGERFIFFRVSCQHCENAPCVSACPTGASYIDEHGAVRIHEDKCVGCDYCVAACPYHVRFINPITKMAEKCDFCSETRLAKGENPACVTVCPTDALLFGKSDDPNIQGWLKKHTEDTYQYQLDGVGKPLIYRRKETHI
ncbi:MAG: 4Fe-4S dicluster domain-containing protein [Saezia sp.]